MSFQLILYWIASYFVGTIMTAWWIGKWKKIDLSKHRSGNLGARNAGAVIGKGAFFLTFFGDAGKGALVVLFGHLLSFPLWAIAVACLIVILGHLFPIWLKGKGGKGIATFIGTALAFNPLLFLAFVIGFLIPFPIIRSATLSMIFGYAAYIVFMFVLDVQVNAWPFLIAIVLIMYKHRFDVQQSWNELRNRVK